MPLLAWRTDADGFSFNNTWTFDSTEQNMLATLAASVAPAAVTAVFGVAIAFAPFLLPELLALLPVLIVGSSGVAYAVTATATLPGFGMCGGMAYTSLDYWYAKAALPYGGNPLDHPMRTTASQTTLRDTIWLRLLDSLNGGGCLQQTIMWSLVLNQLPPQLGGGAGTLLSWTQQEWLKIKASIDAGKPCPIGLIYTTRDVWNQHQILVYGYDAIGNGARLYVYDSNNPHAFGESGFDPANDFLTFDLSGNSLKATSPSDRFGGTLAGFFCTNYSAAPPPAGLATSFGEFITWDGQKNWMTAYGALLPIADATELAALGGTSTDPRMSVGGIPTAMPHPRDNALLRERSSAAVFLYQGGAPFRVPDPTQLMNFGGWSAVRVVPDNTISQFSGFPVNGTLIREFSDTHVFVCDDGVLSLSGIAATSPDVRVVPDGAIRALLLDKLSLDHATIMVGQSCRGTVSLKTAFPGADISVALSSSQPALATVPTSIPIAKGSLSSAPFTVTSTGAAPASVGYAVQITGMVGDSSASSSLVLEPPGIIQFSLSPQIVTAGQSSTATLVLEAGYPAELVVNLFSYSTFATVLSPFSIPPNTPTVTFTVNTPARNYPFVPIAAKIQASYANTTASATLTVQPSVIAGIAQSITLFPSPVTAGGQTTATVRLAAAVNVKTDVSLTSHEPFPQTIFSGPSPLISSMPGKITILAGDTEGRFTVATKSISAQATHRTAVIVAIAVKQVSANLILRP